VLGDTCCTIGDPPVLYTDNEVLPVVPEPSTWALMLLGFAALSFAGYRASRRTAASIWRLLDAYLHAAGILAAKKSPLFRSARGRTDQLTSGPMSRVDVWRMICRRSTDSGLDTEICCHTFRATGITAYLENGGTLENAQLMAAHESPRTTKLYDRTGDEITLDEVERTRFNLMERMRVWRSEGLCLARRPRPR
jgi:hypothetical protein